MCDDLFQGKDMAIVPFDAARSGAASANPLLAAGTSVPIRDLNGSLSFMKSLKRRAPEEEGGHAEVPFDWKKVKVKREKPDSFQLQVSGLFIGDKEGSADVFITTDRCLILNNVKVTSDNVKGVSVQNIKTLLDNCSVNGYTRPDGGKFFLILLLAGTPDKTPSGSGDPAKKFTYIAIQCYPHPYLSAAGSMSGRRLLSIFERMRDAATGVYHPERRSPVSHTSQSQDGEL